MRRTGPSVAIVHDYLNQRGGAERVVLELSRLWPQAPIYTSLYRPESTFEEFRGCDVRTSWMQRLPVDAKFRLMLPLYPLAFAHLGTLLEQELVISSSSGWAHAVKTSPEALHVVYCHAPARWLHSARDYFPRIRGGRLYAHLMRPLRHWDERMARRPDRYVANAHNVAERIRKVYGIEAEVVHPPVDVDRFTPSARGDRLLIVSRLMGYKRLDLVIDAAARLGMELDVVGTGPERRRLEARAGEGVTFHGRLDDAAMLELMQSCNALCFPGREDFGITPVEALAAGKPVVAFADGGALETLEDGVTAAMFTEQTIGAVADAIRRVQDVRTSPEVIARHAQRFSPRAFEDNMRRVVTDVAAAPVARRLPAAA